MPIANTARRLCDQANVDKPPLLPLVPVRAVSHEFGYLFRHYWLPAATLTYRETTTQTIPGNATERRSSILQMEMKKCDSDSCVWHQFLLSTDHGDDLPVRFLVGPDTDEFVFRYDQPNQAVWATPIRAFQPLQQTVRAAQVEALLRLPVMAPLLPIPVGFRWHIDVEAGYMDYCLESVSDLDGTAIARIRRKGVFQPHEIYHDGERRGGRWIVHREGVTVVAVARSTVLEDRLCDRLECDDQWIDGTEIRTVRSLIWSAWNKDRPLAPLFQKFRAESGGHLYDAATGHLVHIDEALYEILDDIGILSNSEIREKYRHLDPAKLDAAFQDLQTMRRKHVLPRHEPCELSRVERVYQNGHERDLGEFWQKTALMLVLGVTERCNLDCGYCCYSGKFAGQRTHGAKSMSLATAKKAIADFLASDHAGSTCPISFYGGEPLLEHHHLVRECVRFAMTTAEKSGKQVRFSITTNGTLLDDETVDFLVEHEFLVMVSLDGPKEAHDRYRVFADGTGSFETIERNLRRFCERYPDYKQRGLSVTLAPPLDLDATARMLDDLYPFFPLSRANLVNTGTEYRFMEQEALPLRYGCHSASSCQKHLEPDSFRRFSDEDRKQIRRYWDKAVAGVTADGSMKSWKKIPFAMMLFEPQISIYHRRPVTNRAPEWLFSIPCIPGFTRRFVDVDGRYRICERVDDSESYILGDVWNGLDVEKLERTMEFRRHCGDCGNCTAVKVCDLCYARLPGSDRPEAGYDPLLERQCRETRLAVPKMLKTYVDIMDLNPNAFDTPMEENMIRYQQIKYGAPASRLDQETLSKLELETL